MESKFKYNEKELLTEIEEYIESTYNQHYIGSDNIQLMDLIMADQDPKEAAGFLRYNAIKYLTRHGKKAGTARADLLKSVHYAILLLHHFDKNQKPRVDAPTNSGSITAASYPK